MLFFTIDKKFICHTDDFWFPVEKMASTSVYWQAIYEEVPSILQHGRLKNKLKLASTTRSTQSKKDTGKNIWESEVGLRNVDHITLRVSINL